MKDDSKIKYGREGRRLETQKHQREARKQGTFHPRGLARAVAHNRFELADVEQINKVHPGSGRSTFSMKWREVSEQMAR